VTVDHSYITYNAGNGIGNPTGEVEVTHSVIAFNTGSGVGNGAAASITYSDIVGNAEYGVYSYAPGQISAKDNYWGSADGPSWDGFPYCDPPPSGSGDKVSCWSVQYRPFSASPYY
jgi:hypothetical protein